MVAQELLSLKGPVSIYGDLWGGAGEGCLESLKSHSLSESAGPSLSSTRSSWHAAGSFLSSFSFL